MDAQQCQHCPTPIQGGAEGMAAHLAVVHPEALRTGQPGDARPPASSSSPAPPAAPGWAPRPRRPVAGHADVAARTLRGAAAAERARRGRAVVEDALRAAPLHPAARAARAAEQPPPTA